VTLTGMPGVRVFGHQPCRARPLERPSRSPILVRLALLGHRQHDPVVRDWSTNSLTVPSSLVV
jgi:hypothetical protein